MSEGPAEAIVDALRANGQPHAETCAGAELDPLVAQHCREVASCEGLAIVHPNWWGGPPAILKGWVDRVLRAGVAYRFEAGDGDGWRTSGLGRRRCFRASDRGPAPDRPRCRLAPSQGTP